MQQRARAKTEPGLLREVLTLIATLIYKHIVILCPRKEMTGT